MCGYGIPDDDDDDDGVDDEATWCGVVVNGILRTWMFLRGSVHLSTPMINHAYFAASTIFDGNFCIVAVVGVSVEH